MIDPGTSIGAVHLTIADLDRSLAFYQSHLGLRVHERTASAARLGVDGADLVSLVESPEAPRAPGATGLYHFALLVPSRFDLARSLQRFVDMRTPMQGFSDHGVSEALYLADPDGNGIEVYRDRPRDEWPTANGRLQMTLDPLDLANLLGELDGRPLAGAWPGLMSGTRMGHMHLQVSHIGDAEAFYAGVLGFEVMARYGRGALFVAAGGYHHHVGLNTWAGVGAPAPPPGAIGLRHFEIRFASEPARAAVLERLQDAGVGVVEHEDGCLVRDPSHNGLLLALAVQT